MTLTWPLMILTVIIVTCLFTCNYREARQTGGDGMRAIDLSEMKTDTHAHYHQLDHVDNYLHSPINYGDTEVEDIKPSNYKPDLIPYVKRLPLPKRVDDNINAKDLIKIRKRQHYFFDDPVVVRRDGQIFYYDWHYPRKPISIEFLRNPRKYVLEHPQVYPSYIIYARNSPWRG